MFNRLTQPGELLTTYMQWVHTNINKRLIKKLLTCAWCLAGQLALWTDVLMLLSQDYNLYDFVLISINIPACILIVYEFSIKGN